MEDKFSEYIKDEVAFCKENENVQNEHGQFIYISTDGAESINLPMILRNYRDWLVEKHIVKD